MKYLTRREFMSVLGTGAAAAAVLGAGSIAGARAAEAPAGSSAGGKGGAKRPNVLFIAVDDLRPQLGCYGHKEIISPNIDRLAASGIRLDRAYCQQAICAASRCSLLSGCRPDTTKIYDLDHPLRQMMPDIVSLPQLFKTHGYTTISLGKIYHHRDDDLVGWSEAPDREKGGWKGRGYLAPESIEDIQAESANAKAKAGQARPAAKTGLGPAFEGPDVPDNAYADGVISDNAIARLRKFAAAGEPFFLAVGFYKPHLPFNAPKKYWDMYPPEKVRLPANNTPPTGATRFTLTDWGELRAYTGIPKAGPCSEKLTRQLIRGYCACVTYTDAMIGRVLDELDRLKLRQNTVIVLWGDHGWKLGEYGCWCKHTNVELDTRAPLIFSGPSIKPGQVSEGLCEFVDIYPTLAELCGLAAPKTCEGVSLVPLMTDPNRAWKSAAFSQYPRGAVMGYTMRTDRWRYTRWVDRPTGKAVAEELYDHQVDPGENHNVLAGADQAVLDKLRAQTDAGWKASRPR
jgi:arylsulfatase A-like enzyme